MEEYYNISKDYEELYDLVNAGNKIFCFADYSGMNRRKPPLRDLCLCKRTRYDNIEFQSRGMCYGSVSNDDLDVFAKTEKGLFIILCNECHIEWVKNNKV